MEITLESVEKNTEKYNENLNKIMQERAELMEQITDLRKRKEQLDDDIEIAKLNLEEAELVQKINDITYSLKNDKLTLEQLQNQKDALEMKIDKKKFSDKSVENRKAKAKLSADRDVEYYSNEVKKCKRAISLYLKMGDSEKVDFWRKKQENAEKDLEFAMEEAEKESNSQKKDSKEIEENPEKKQEEVKDEIKKEEKRNEENKQTDEKQVEYEKKVAEYDDDMHQVLKDKSGKEIGYRNITERTDVESGKREIETVGNIENENGLYEMKEITKGTGDELEFQRKELKVDSKVTGDKEEHVYQKDNNGNEMYFRNINGSLSLKITKNARGITIDRYNKGQLIETYEYDKDGNAIEGIPGVEKLSEGYLESSFDREMPDFEVKDTSFEYSQKDENGNILKDTIKETEESTRMGKVNEELQNIKNRQKQKTQDMNLDNVRE